MASLGCRPQENGQVFHAWRQPFASCLLSLLLCIALLHATVAPTQHRPLTGTAVLYEVRAASVHSETITDLALAATQTAYTETSYTDWVFHIAKPSYARIVMIARSMPRLACHRPSHQRSLHADDCSIARTLLNPHQHANVSNKEKPPSTVCVESILRCRQQVVTLPKCWSKPWQEPNATSYMLQPTQSRTSTCDQLSQTSNTAGEPCCKGMHANGHQTPDSMSNMHSVKSRVTDKPTTHIAIRQYTSVTSTHTSVNNYVLTPRRPLDAVEWHSTQMAVAVSHLLYSCTLALIVPMLLSLKPDFVWIFADDLFIVHNGMLPSIEVPIHWHQHCHHTHVSSEVVQAVQTLTNDLRMQSRSLAEWEPTEKIVLQTSKNITFALIGLLFPCAVTVALQAIQLVALISTTLRQLTMQLTQAVPRMQCSILYYVHQSVCCVDSTLKQAHGSTHLLIMLCDALMLCLSTGVDVREAQLYMSAMEAICIAGLMIGILILHLMSEYEDLLMHATGNNQRTHLGKFDHPKCANGKYWSRIRYFKKKFIRPSTRKLGVGYIKAESV